MGAVDPIERRSEIVEAAFSLVAEGGIEAATMRRIATAAGATTGRVTHYFDSRVEVLVAVLVEVDTRHQERIAAHSGLEPAARLRATLSDRLALDSERVDEQRVWVALSTTDIPELRDELSRQRTEWDHRVSSLLDEVRGRRSDHTSSWPIVAVVDGLSLRLMHACASRTRRDARQVLDDALARAVPAG